MIATDFLRSVSKDFDMLQDIIKAYQNRLDELNSLLSRDDINNSERKEFQDEKLQIELILDVYFLRR
jgi:hypothetical protein